MGADANDYLDKMNSVLTLGETSQWTDAIRMKRLSSYRVAQSIASHAYKSDNGLLNPTHRNNT